MTIAKAPFVADELDHLLFATFPGLVIRKDLAQEIRGTSKAPSYVIEFMLGKYCANLFDDAEVRQQWVFKSCRAQGIADDEISVAFG